MPFWQRIASRTDKWYYTISPYKIARGSRFFLEFNSRILSRLAGGCAAQPFCIALFCCRLSYARPRNSIEHPTAHQLWAAQPFLTAEGGCPNGSKLRSPYARRKRPLRIGGNKGALDIAIFLYCWHNLAHRHCAAPPELYAPNKRRGLPPYPSCKGLGLTYMGVRRICPTLHDSQAVSAHRHSLGTLITRGHVHSTLPSGDSPSLPSHCSRSAWVSLAFFNRSGRFLAVFSRAFCRCQARILA